MSSGGHRGFTVVTIMTLIFAPFFSHNHWIYKLVSTNTATTTVMCVVHQACPARQVIVNIVKPDLPADPAKDKGKVKTKDEQG
jgi:hypothetical protein